MICGFTPSGLTIGCHQILAAYIIFVLTWCLCIWVLGYRITSSFFDVRAASIQNSLNRKILLTLIDAAFPINVQIFGLLILSGVYFWRQTFCCHPASLRGPRMRFDMINCWKSTFILQMHCLKLNEDFALNFRRTEYAAWIISRVCDYVDSVSCLSIKFQPLQHNTYKWICSHMYSDKQSSKEISCHLHKMQA